MPSPTTTLRTAGGDLVIPRVIVSDIASVARQQIIDGLGLFRGEWFLNRNDGFPWFQTLFGVKLTSTAQINQALRQFLLSVPNVVSVVASSVLDGARRLFTYTFEAFLSNGLTLAASSNGGIVPIITITGAP